MIKTLSKAQKMEREKFRIPRSVQDAIPIRRIFADGIFQVGNQYSKTWSFTDINYAIAGKEDKTSMFLDYSELLNALDSGASAKITIYNRRINKAEFERTTWQESERKRLSYRTLNERAASEALKVENKRDQKQMDDHAARGARYKQR